MNIKSSRLRAMFEQALSLHSGGRLAEAIDAYKRLLQADPRQVTVLYHLGIAEHRMQRPLLAIAALQTATKLAPDFVQAWQSLAQVRLDLRDLAGAEAACRQVLRLQPDQFQTGLRLTQILLWSNRAQDAERMATQWLRARPQDPDLIECQASARLQLGRSAQALYDTLTLLAGHAARGSAWALLCACFEAESTRLTRESTPLLLGAGFPDLVDRALADGIALYWPSLQLGLRHFFAAELAAAPSLAKALTLLTRPAYRVMLTETVLIDPDAELALTALRQALLESFIADGEPSEVFPHESVAVLATYFFRSEYAAFETELEQRLLRWLETGLEAAVAAERESVLALVLFACYRPLHRLDAAPRLCGSRAGALGELMLRQFDEPRIERQLAGTLSPLTPITHPTSTDVRAMYEDNPYPRWRRLPPIVPLSGSFADRLEARLPGLVAPVALQQPDFPVLIAGCGTGEQPLSLAALLPRARLTAVDLSLASLGYAMRMARETRTDSITFAHGDLLELGGLGTRFPYIECVGVLHHLAQPQAGLAVLARCLEPGGLLKLALYSERARAHFGIRQGQDFVRQGGYGTTPPEIRRFRRAVIERRDDPSLQPVLIARDFYSLSECRDLFFHVMEHRYRPTDLEALCSSAGLEFVGFEEPMTGAFAAYAARFADDPARRSLAHWDAFEADNPSLFVRMFVFYLRKPGGNSGQR